MRTLLFQNNVHNTEPIEIPHEDKPRAVNLTVRRGLKWADLKVGDVVEVCETGKQAEVTCGNQVWATIYDVKVMSFADLMNYQRLLKLEHDPRCQSYTGLFETMRRVYDGFLQHELVTLVFYELREATCPYCGKPSGPPDYHCDCPDPCI